MFKTGRQRSFEDIFKKYFVWEYLRYKEKRAECFMLFYWYRLTDFEKI